MKLFKIGLLFGVVLIACICQSQAQNITKLGNAQGTNNSQSIEGTEVRVNVTDVQQILESIINSLPIGGIDIAPQINITEANSSLPIEITEAKADIAPKCKITEEEWNEDRAREQAGSLIFLYVVLGIIGSFMVIFGIAWLLRYSGKCLNRTRTWKHYLERQK
jgi:hypothetical protein